jgi:hypothetical protein
MSKERPDHHDADLLIKVYDLRREEVMRKSRSMLLSQFWPKTYDEVKTVTTNGDHALNAAYRQCGTYWEMVYGMVKHGIVHADYFLESNGEGMFLFARVAPYLEQLRKDASPYAFRNAEWVARETTEGRRLFEMFQKRVEAKLATLR